ncbi:MAG: serine protease, partial [Deltaproteobacteria bacterium]|nr:serine protease [Deltaproteobacteria bacterium]
TIPLPLGDSNKIIVGEDVVGIGNTEGLEGSISLGVIYDVRTADGVDFIQITAPILPGCSGGPVFNLAGEVIGISTAFLDLGEDLNFAMPVNYLKILKPTRLKLRSLSRFENQLEVTVRDGAVVELLDIRYQKSSGTQKRNRNHRTHQNSNQSPHSVEYSNNSDEQSVNGSGNVYFKNGKRLFCERAWRYGGKIFLVVHGKKVAISYNENEIDMRKSFDLSR